MTIARLTTLTLSMSVVFAMNAATADDAVHDDEVDLGVQTVTVSSAVPNQANLLGKRQNISDQTIKAKELKQRATTLGDALDGELGIHSNQFGGGASTPIIRGQEGKRITILQNNADVIDMAHLSPDHAVMVDTVLANRAEVVRGASTLLYKSGNLAGAVNIIDNKIPHQYPNKPIESEVGLRFNTGNNEKLATGGMSARLGNHWAVRVEGLHKSASNYYTPNYVSEHFDNWEALDRYVKAPQRLASLEKEWNALKTGTPLSWRDKTYFIQDEAGYLKQKAILDKDSAGLKQEPHDNLPESWADSKAGSVGLSWIGDKGYIGVAISERKDQYGLPAHNHLYEGCGVISTHDSLRDKPYLARYPQLLDEDDINYINPRPDCATHAHENFNHSHGVHKKHDHNTPPYIDLTTRRYDLRTQWDNPVSWVSKIRGNIGYVDYQHDEKEGDVVSTSFINKGKVARLELTHDLSSRLKALWGVQYIEQDNQGLSPQTEWRKLPLLTQNNLKNQSIFAMGQYDTGKLQVELASRIEKQKVAMDYDLDYIEEVTRRRHTRLTPEKLEQVIAYGKDAAKPHQQTAHSYALGVHYQFLPNYKLSLNIGKQERLPNSQELYTHGMHLATNSFEIGNRHLSKERAKHYELGLSYQGDKLDYQLSGYLYDFDNYIYLHTINEYLGTAKVAHPLQLHINRYDQSPAKFYGFEGKIGYQFNDTYYGAIFGDYVNGKLHDLPPIVSDFKKGWFGNPDTKTYIKPDDRYTPRLPPMRLGAKLNANFDEKWSANVEYVKTFEQKKISNFESPTKGHHLVNVGVDYQNAIGASQYSIFFKANNLLDQKVYAHETYLPYIPQMGRHFSLGVNFKY
ncbi:TonB-dependent receptor [Moraxella sp.]|uniref:TonB-dependent receptor n=1 Tax=Moraxella sp. TaxID=479 RepID=UPI0026DAF9E6|nr:TonB-dependent receptor [Moraxella sp.]MDO4894814.1 TonB-dependent receptor [Moraxella sp.]